MAADPKSPGSLRRTPHAGMRGSCAIAVLALPDLSMSEEDGEPVEPAHSPPAVVVLPPRGGRGEQL
ncbi:hypothetical protein [Parasphingorhabdus pacifica]